MTEWDELRSRARHLETELDAKLVSFSKMGNRAGVSSIEMEIDELLIELDSVTDRMALYAETSSAHTNATVAHTLTRHRDILQDYRNEYRKTKTNISASQAREDLLGSVQRDIEEYRGMANTRQELYQRERDHLLSSDRLADTAIEMASRTQDHLRQQRRMLGGLSSRMLDLAARFPQLNYLIQKISMRKRRDTVIMASVISFCIILILLYAFH